MKFFATLATASALSIQSEANMMTQLLSQAGVQGGPPKFLCDTNADEVWTQFNTNKDKCLSWGEVTAALSTLPLSKE